MNKSSFHQGCMQTGLNNRPVNYSVGSIFLLNRLMREIKRYLKMKYVWVTVSQHKVNIPSIRNRVKHLKRHSLLLAVVGPFVVKLS